MAPFMLTPAWVVLPSVKMIWVRSFLSFLSNEMGGLIVLCAFAILMIVGCFSYLMLSVCDSRVVKPWFLFAMAKVSMKCVGLMRSEFFLSTPVICYLEYLEYKHSTSQKPFAGIGDGCGNHLF